MMGARRDERVESVKGGRRGEEKREERETAWGWLETGLA
jgi:hypothetical protein